VYPDIQLSLPAWVVPFLQDQPDVFPSDEDKMDLVVALSRRNLTENTGGPFGAGVFDQVTGQLVAPGVNLVVAKSCSAAHAEIVALSLAQRVLNTHDLGGTNQPAHTLVSSTEPCAMCLGAVPWSGVSRLVCGATGEDAENIGMDEGAKPSQWVSTLVNRGIEVKLAVRRAEAVAVLNDYAASGAEIYNGRKGAEDC